MTLSELIDQLTELQQECGDEDPQVMMAHQPNWPLQMPLASVVLHDPDPEGQQSERTVYVAEGWGGNGYLTEGVSELLGWR